MREGGGGGGGGKAKTAVVDNRGEDEMNSDQIDAQTNNDGEINVSNLNTSC